jgi:hypothetical protein
LIVIKANFIKSLTKVRLGLLCCLGYDHNIQTIRIAVNGESLIISVVDMVVGVTMRSMKSAREVWSRSTDHSLARKMMHADTLLLWLRWSTPSLIMIPGLRERSIVHRVN